MKLSELLSPNAILADLEGHDAAAIFTQLCTPLAREVGIPVQELVAALLEREALASTGLGDGVALPHGVHAGLTRIVAAFGRSRAGVAFAAPDGRPAHLFFALIRPPDAAGAHLKALAKISHVLASATVREALLAAETADAMHEIILARAGDS